MNNNNTKLKKIKIIKKTIKDDTNNNLINNKKKLGQFYTTNYDYILQGMKIPPDTKYIVEPFAGNGDLLNFINNSSDYNIECYDIDPKQKFIIQRNTLENPPNYDGKFILTNPPYLARNKNKDKKLYNKYKCNDLYKCFIINIIDSDCLGGIIIIPLNFISSIRKNDIELRMKFLQKFRISRINIFEEQIFDDTSYAICSIQFIKGSSNSFKAYIYPSNKILNLTMNKDNNYTIGGEIYALNMSNKYKIERATKFTNDSDNITNILLKCLDDNINNKIQLMFINDNDKEQYIDKTPNLTFRSYALLTITPKIELQKQKDLINKFNTFLEKKRDEYNSLFLTNYRESNSIARKRISFNLAFRICSHLLN